MTPKFLSILKSPKAYCRLVGGILFLVGLIGFAFRSDNSLPDFYLVASMVLGFWGVVISFSPDRTPNN